jgi:hypothetical protein
MIVTGFSRDPPALFGVFENVGPALAVAAALALAGCAPRLVWMGGDEGRGVRAEVLAANGAQWVRVAGREGPRFDAVGESGVAFSPGGRRLAYPAQRDGRWWMVLDGREDGPWESVAEPAFSRGGERFAFLAQTRGRWLAVVDGARGPAFDLIQAGSLQFSSSAHVGYVGLSPGCATIVIDGVLGNCHDAIVSFRPTDLGSAAVIRDGQCVRFLLGEEVGPPFAAIGEWAIADDGNRAAYAASDRGGWLPVIDGVAGRRARSVGSFRFGNRGRRVAFIRRDESSASVVVDQTEGPPFALVSRLALASSGPGYAYAAEDEHGAWVIADGQRGARFAAVLDLALSTDGRHLVFVARRGGNMLVVYDGRETAFDLVMDETLVLSDDGEHWAVLAGDTAARQFYVSIDGAIGRTVASGEIFGDSRSLRPWIARELAMAIAPRTMLGASRAAEPR